MEFLCLFCQFHMLFQYMEPLSFFGRLIQKVKYFLLQVYSFGKRLNDQMAALRLQVIPSFHSKFPKISIFFSTNTYEKIIASKEYCFARHDDKMCVLPNCRFQILLLGNAEHFLQRLDSLCFIYQHVDCLYTVFKNRFSGNVVFKSGLVFDNVRETVWFNQGNKGLDRLPSVAEKRLLRKKYRKLLMSSFGKTKSMETSRSIFAEKNEQVKKIKYELEFVKIVDGYAIYSINSTTFEIKTL